MSDREIDINLTNSTSTRVSHEPTADEVREYTARMVGIYDRGLVLDRLNVPIPPELWGEWAPRDQIDEYTIKGFRAGDEFVPKSLNDRGDGRKSTLDVVFMVKERWKHDVDEKLKLKRYHEAHTKDYHKMKEEQDFEQSNREIGMPVESKKGHLTQSVAENISGPEITQVLQTK